MQLRSILKHLDLCIRVSFSCNKHQDFISHFGYKPKIYLHVSGSSLRMNKTWVTFPMWIVRPNGDPHGLEVKSVDWCMVHNYF